MTRHTVTITDIDGRPRASVRVSSSAAARTVMFAAVDRVNAWGVRALHYTMRDHLHDTVHHSITLDEYLPKRK